MVQALVGAGGRAEIANALPASRGLALHATAYEMALCMILINLYQ